MQILKRSKLVHEVSALSLTLACALLMLTQHATAAPQASAEFTLAPGSSTYPMDCAVTYSNNWGGVRYANPNSNALVLSFWSLRASGLPTSPSVAFGGGALQSGYQHSLTFTGFPYKPSDGIEMNNMYSVSIGSDLSGTGSVANYQDLTYIEVVDVSANPPAFVTQFALPPLPMISWGVDHAGYANDVEITPDGTWAVINADNWIYVIHLPSMVLYSFQISDIDYNQLPLQNGWNMPCTPNEAVDSVAVTNEVAVVTTSRPPLASTARTWVYLLDLTSVPPTIKVQYKIVLPNDPFVNELPDRPHDVKIMTDSQGIGLFAVVTTTHSVAAYDLSSFSHIGTYFDRHDWRLYQTQVDSVEVSAMGDAVVISDNDNNTGSVKVWHVMVFHLSSTATPFTKSGDFSPGSTLAGRAHDLAVDKAYDVGVVRSSFDNLILPSIASASTTPLTILSSPNQSDAYLYGAFSSSNAFSSDAAVIGTDSSGNLTAVTLGAYQVVPYYYGAVDAINLSAASPILTQVALPPDVASNKGSVPLDFAFSLDRSEVVVRSADPYYSTTSTLEEDLVRINLILTSAGITRYRGTGLCLGTDSLASPASGLVNTTRRTLSISHDPQSANDYVHIAH